MSTPPQEWATQCRGTSPRRRHSQSEAAGMSATIDSCWPWRVPRPMRAVLVPRPRSSSTVTSQPRPARNGASPRPERLWKRRPFSTGTVQHQHHGGIAGGRWPAHEAAPIAAARVDHRDRRPCLLVAACLAHASFPYAVDCGPRTATGLPAPGTDRGGHDGTIPGPDQAGAGALRCRAAATSSPDPMSNPLQLGLLDDDGTPLPAARSDLASWAHRLPADVHLGTSSWSFPGWAGLVYDRRAGRRELARHGLAAYAAHPLMRAVGVDRSYYGALETPVWRAYADQVPADFRFVVKAPARVTDPRRRDTGASNRDFLEPGPAGEAFAAMRAGLGERLALVVCQFPPAPTIAVGAFAERLHRFLAALEGPLSLACEIRTPAWLDPAYASALTDTGTTHCYTVHPSMPAPSIQATRMGTPPPGPFLARWNLAGGQQYEAARRRYWPFDRIVDPDPASRSELVDGIRAARARGERAYVTVNNKAEGSAPLSVEALAAAVAGTAPSAGA